MPENGCLFRNKDLESCTTDYLNYDSYDFSFDYDTIVTIDTNVDKHGRMNNQAVEALGSCRLGTFRPDEELWFQVIATR